MPVDSNDLNFSAPALNAQTPCQAAAANSAGARQEHEELAPAALAVDEAYSNQRADQNNHPALENSDVPAGTDVVAAGAAAAAVATDASAVAVAD